jgi:hypothetical protein
MVEIRPGVPAIIDQGRDDFDTARTSILDALATSKDAVEQMVAIASQSQHPKAYEVLDKMLNTLSRISIDLTNVEVQKRKIIAAEDPSPTTVNNTMVVGSTAELLKMIADARNNGPATND